MHNLRFIGLVILVCVCDMVHAQNFQGGIFWGINGSQVDGDGVGGYNKFGFNVGAYVSYPITEKIDGSLELKYIRKGQVINPDYEQDAADVTYFKTNLHYVQLPVLVRYQLPYNFSIHTGVSFAYLVDYNFFDEYGALSKDGVGYEYKKMELASILGIRYAITDRMFLDGRWSMSVLPVANFYRNASSTPGSIQQAGNAFNRSLELSLGYQIGH